LNPKKSPNDGGIPKFSLQMGFKTLAIERRSSEVWRVLGGVKNEFAKFGGVLTKTKILFENERRVRLGYAV